MKLAICTLKTTGEQFTFYGDYEIQEETEVAANADSISYKYPEFDGITTKRYVNGTEEDYIPTQSTWSGRKIDCEDMLGDLIAYSMRGEDCFSVTYLEEGLQELIDTYTSDFAVSVSGKSIPNGILYSDMYRLYQLWMVTDQYIYYANDDSVIMLETDTHALISDNYFAEDGYWQSVEKIHKGKEKLLFGQLPEEDQ